ncbi:MAG: hypothetical protein GY703_21700 [Gammaproteobacteria bacterium]|nr:hypothetical protein [Gammaproteobacteria bacterium]
MLNQNDPETVRTGAPAYLLLLDSLIVESPDDRKLLTAAARLYGAYAGALVSDPNRSKRLSTQSRNYARRALCIQEPRICDAESDSFDIFAAAVDDSSPDHLAAVYTQGVSWAGWVQTHADDWSALAELPRAEYLLQRVVDIQPGYDRGRAQLYLGVLRTQLPPALGGKPETGRYHFERAIEYSKGRDLMAKVEFARRYSRLVFDQSLHDRLLREVLAAAVEEPDLTLSNTIAQQQARILLSEDYF